MMIEGPTPLSARLRARAARRRVRIVLPESDDPRVLRAVAWIRDARLAEPVLIGAPDALAAAAAQVGVDLDGVACVDPADPGSAEELLARYLARPGVRQDQAAARELFADPVFFATLLLDAGRADGLVAGARTTTGATVEPALRLRRLRPGMPPVTSCFLMELPPGRLAEEIGDVLVFADCALNPQPTAALLARIAMAAAATARELLDLDPRVALLSSSTKGSATSDRIEVVKNALAEVTHRAPELVVDGEMQVDAALLSTVGETKAPGSPVAGRANVLIFPDLESGNIAYKLVERLAGARAIGPLFSGLNWPVNDLSRGCSVDDVIDVVAVTAIRAGLAVG